MNRSLHRSQLLPFQQQPTRPSRFAGRNFHAAPRATFWHIPKLRQDGFTMNLRQNPGLQKALPDVFGLGDPRE